MEILTTQVQFETLHEIADTRAKTVRVDTQALINLLTDHSALIRTARGKGIRVNEPQPSTALRRARAAL